MPSKDANRLYVAMKELKAMTQAPAINIADAIRLAGLTEEEGRAALKELEQEAMVRDAGSTIREDY